MANSLQSTLTGIPDARSLQGMLARGANVYQSSMSANGNSGTPNLVADYFGNGVNGGYNPAITGATPTNAVPASVGNAIPAAPKGIGNSGNTGADFNYWTDLNNIFRDTSQLDSEANLQAGRNKSDLASAYEQASRNYGKTKEAGLNSRASKGMLFSGQTVKQQADIGEDYSRTNQNIAQAGQRSFEDLARATVQRKQLLEQQRLDIERQQAQAKANEDLRRALVEAQTKAAQDFKSALIGAGIGANSNVNMSTGIVGTGTGRTHEEEAAYRAAQETARVNADNNAAVERQAKQDTDDQSLHAEWDRIIAARNR